MRNDSDARDRERIAWWQQVADDYSDDRYREAQLRTALRGAIDLLSSQAARLDAQQADVEAMQAAFNEALAVMERERAMWIRRYVDVVEGP